MLVLKKLQSESTITDIDSFNKVLLWRNQMLLHNSSDISGDEILIGGNYKYSSISEKYNFPLEDNVIVPEDEFKQIFEVIIWKFWSI